VEGLHNVTYYEAVILKQSLVQQSTYEISITRTWVWWIGTFLC